VRAVITLNADLDQFMGIQAHGDFAQYGLAQAVVADHHDRVESLSQALEVLALEWLQFDFHWTGLVSKQNGILLEFGP
jgi:hypothetical protein